MLRPLQRRETDSTTQQQRDVAKSSSADAPPPNAQEMEQHRHQRYGEAQPQLVPSDVIETMMMGKGRRGDGLGGL